MSKVLKTGKTMKVVYAEAEEPVIPTREECADLTDAEFEEWKADCEKIHEAWVKLQADSKNVDMGDESDSEHGPGATGWVNPDSITGPGVK